MVRAFTYMYKLPIQEVTYRTLRDAVHEFDKQKGAV
jgi:hypothetical protein